MPRSSARTPRCTRSRAGGFDAVVSRTGASFFGDPPAAFANLARATAPGGRLALLTWQAPARNEWFVEITGALAGRPFPGPPPGVPSPFALADPDAVATLLGGAGFVDVQIADVHEPAEFGADPVAARDVMAELLGWLLDGRDAEAARAALLADDAGPRGPGRDHVRLGRVAGDGGAHGWMNAAFMPRICETGASRCGGGWCSDSCGWCSHPWRG